MSCVESFCADMMWLSESSCGLFSFEANLFSLTVGSASVLDAVSVLGNHVNLYINVLLYY